MSSKTRILEVTATLKPAGAEHVIVSLASSLDPDRYEVGVVSLFDAFPGGLEPLLESAHIPVWHLGKVRGPDPRMYVRLSNLVRAFRPDIIHSHCYVTRYTFHLPALAKVHTIHNLAELEVGLIGRMFNRSAFRLGVVPVAVGRTVADTVRRLYGSPYTLSIPNGIDTLRFWHPEQRNLWRCQNGFGDEDILVVSVGRLERQKNPMALVAAMKSVPRAQLLLVGEGSLRKRVEGHERVQVLGIRNDIPEILAAADIFALASDWEGLPLAVLEAMAAGLPVVVTSVGGVPDIVQHGVTGLLVERSNCTELSGALNRLVENRMLRSRMGTAARMHAQSFSLQSMATAYEELFDQLLGAKAAAAVA